MGAEMRGRHHMVRGSRGGQYVLRKNISFNLPIQLRDYNSLPVGKYRQLKVAGIDGTDR